MAKSETLLRYFHENVLRAYADYRKAHDERAAGRSNDLYYAKKVAEVLYHFREQLPGKRGYAEFRDKCHDYRLIRDIANASKHGEDKRKPDPKRDAPLIDGPKSIYECLVSTTYYDNQGEYRNTEKGVFVKLLDGTERDFFEVATNVMNMWCKEMLDMGEIQKPIHFVLKKSNRATTKKRVQYGVRTKL